MTPAPDACRVCGGTASPWRRVRGCAVSYCAACDYYFVPTPPPFAYECEYYQAPAGSSEEKLGYADYAAEEENGRAQARQRLDSLPAAEGMLLDIGCAYGYFAAEARAAGRTVAGMEYSRWGCGEAARRGVAVARADGGRLPLQNACCVQVTAWDVFEHVPDPGALARECARVLRPGGGLVLTTGIVDSLLFRLQGTRWHLLKPPEHLSFFSRQALRRLLEPAGFIVQEMRTEPQRVNLSYVAWRLRLPLRLPGAATINLHDIVRVTACRVN